MIGKSKFAMTVALMTVMAMCFAGIVVDDPVDAEITDVTDTTDDLTYNVTYKMDGAEDVVIPVKSDENGKFTVTVETPEDLNMTVPYGKQFVKWTAPDMDEVGDELTLTGNITLTAVLEALPAYTVTFVDEDGTTEIAKYVCFEGSTPVAPEAPAKEGMTFKGWSINGVNVIEIPTVTADATYVAVYVVNMYTVTFMDGDRVVYTFEIEHGKTITLGDVPTGFDWDFDFTAPITGDVTINPVVEVEPEPEPVPAEPEDNSTTYALLAVLAIIVVVGLFVAVWYIKKEKD